MHNLYLILFTIQTEQEHSMNWSSQVITAAALT